MSTFQAILLGIIQGVTEFLPISSSGHLMLAQWLFGFEDLSRYVLFDLVCHLGTLLAIFCVYFKTIKLVVCFGRRQMAQIGVALLPLFPLLLFLKPLESVFNSPQLLGWFFLLTALLLYLGISLGPTSPLEDQHKNHPWRDPFVIGLFQALAVLPGVSRSGATISAARMLGWDYPFAIQFSFLLAIPTILGAMVVETWQWWKGEKIGADSLAGIDYFWGFLFSFVVGFFALKALIQLASKGKFLYFVWYCLAMGTATLVYTHFFI